MPPTVLVRPTQTAANQFKHCHQPIMPPTDDPSADEIAAQAAALAAHLQRSGVQFLPAADPRAVETISQRFPQPTPSAAAPPATPPAPARSPAEVAKPKTKTAPRSRPALTLDLLDEDQYPEQALPPDDRQAALDVIATEVAACKRCEVLSNCRNKTVFGEGSVQPRVAFFGEGPGADEDRTGRPFVGRAGQLLTKMIEACSFRREDVYILNTVKCRPPGNRNPEPDEIANCRNYFERQLSILRPEYIVCLGAVGSQTLLNSKLSVGRLRGKLHRYFESKVLVTYHPAYLLRNPAAKKATWEDLQIMLRDAGIDPKARK
ncbi:MAG: uracil-DNA glycosylase [Pirellulales bacterium]|nr:uracil-DNA glycosylase [Pirellulales bacterium]